MDNPIFSNTVLYFAGNMPLDLDKRPHKEGVLLLDEVAGHISAKHTRRLAREYLGIGSEFIETMEMDNARNAREVTFQCMRKFLRKERSQNKLYEKLKQAGIQEGLVPGIALDTFAGNCLFCFN